jgi:hypothetical protein
VVLQDDGSVAVCGLNNFGQCNIPKLPPGIRYTAVAAGTFFTVLLRDDGLAVACGLNNYGQLNIPAILESCTSRYVKVAAGFFHTLLLRDDGQVVSCGQNDDGQLNIPTPPEDVVYVGMAGGGMHTILLASDGHAIACGMNQDGQCDVHEPPPGVRYVSSLLPDAQLDIELQARRSVTPADPARAAPDLDDLRAISMHPGASASIGAYSCGVDHPPSSAPLDDAYHVVVCAATPPQVSDGEESVLEELEADEHSTVSDASPRRNLDLDLADDESVPEELEPAYSPDRALTFEAIPAVAPTDCVEEDGEATTDRSPCDEKAGSFCERESTATSVPTDDED